MALSAVPYFPEMNLLRGMAILGVISIHVSGVFTDMELVPLSFLYMSIDTFSHYAVPLFIFISGFVLYNKYKADFSIPDFYKKRFLTIVPPYLIFSGIALLLIFFTSRFFGRSVDLDLSDIAYRLLTGQSLYHLWFFIVIIQLYLFYPLIVRIFNDMTERGAGKSLLIIAFLIQIFYSVIIVDTMGIFYDLSRFIGYIGFFILGMFTRTKIEEVNRAKLTGKTGILIWMILLVSTLLGVLALSQKFFNLFLWSPDSIEQSTFVFISTVMYPLSLIITIFIFYIAAKAISTGSKGYRTLDIIGTLSFGIYLVHAFILYGLELVSGKIGYTGINPSYYPTMCIITLLSSVAIILLIRKIPHHQYIIGK